MKFVVRALSLYNYCSYPMRLNFEYKGSTATAANSYFSGKTVVLTGTLSKYGRKEATEILSIATTILFNTIPYRKEFNINNPGYHINSWDNL